MKEDWRNEGMKRLKRVNVGEFRVLSVSTWCRKSYSGPGKGCHIVVLGHPW